MEQFSPGSQAFVQEAVRRALSQSELGHVVIQDHTEAARFSGAMPGEGHFNYGTYTGPRTVSLVPGSQFGLLIVPSGTVQRLWETPNDVALDPIFSLATANPDDSLQWGQITDLDGSGHLFALEDIRVNGHSDRDYNDIILRVDGAIGLAPRIDSLIDPNLEWRHTNLGQSIRRTDVPPERLYPDAEPFNLTLDFGDDFSESQRTILETAARSIEHLITQGIPDAWINGERIDDLRIQLSIQDLDGTGGTLARTRLDILREDGTHLPLQAITQFDSSDLAALEASGHLFSVMQHELLHALGFGTLWERLGLLENNRTPNAQYMGENALNAFRELGGLTDSIPVEPNRINAPALYWNERLFQNELMTADLGPNAPLSPITLAALQDLGYQVDLSHADPTYRLLGGMLAPQADLTPEQQAAIPDLTTDSEALQQSPDPQLPNTGDDGWAHSGSPSAQAFQGRPNILWRNPGLSRLDLWGMNGTTLMSSIPITPNVGSNWDLVGTGDFNRDGQQDLVWHNRSTSDGRVNIWLMNGTTLLSSATIGTMQDMNWRIAGVADFNQDSIPDLLWRNANTTQNALWQFPSNSPGVPQAGYHLVYPLPNVSTNWVVGGIADFNQDGKLDILWRDATTQRNSLWLMDHNVSTGHVTLPTASSAWQMQGVGDFNQDGNPDVLWRNPNNGQNSVWLMHQTTVLSTVALPPVTANSWHMVGTMPMTATPPSNLALAPESDSWIPSDRITNLLSLTLTGNAQPGAWVRLYADGLLFGTVRTGADGTWRITGNLPQNTTGRMFTFTATATTPFGLTSLASAPLTVDVDTQPPNPPILRLDPNISSTGTSLVDRTLTDNTPTVTLTTNTATSAIDLYQVSTSASGQPVHTRLGPATFIGGQWNNTWEWTPNQPLADGVYAIVAKAIDIAGNVSPASHELRLAIVPPANLFTAALAHDSGAADGITNTATIQGSLDRTRIASLWGSFGSAAPVDLTPWLNADGSFTLGPDALAAVLGEALPDGEHTLVLQPKRADGSTWPSHSLRFTLDTTPPALSTGNLLDGITWDSDTGEWLEGDVWDTRPGTSVAYYFNGNGQQSVPIHLNADGSFNRLVGLVGLPRGVHTLTVQATDQAGNQQSHHYNFQLVQEQPPLDPEVDEHTPPPPPQTNRGGTTWPNRSFSSDGDWGGGSWGWGWTSGGSGDGTNTGDGADPLFWAPPEPSTPDPVEPEPEIPYVERVQVAVETAALAMPFGSRRAALRHRTPVLVETAEQIDAPGNQFYDRFQHTFYGLYYLASTITTRSQAENLGYYLAGQLADPDDPAVRVQTMQHNLLTAVNHTLQQSGQLPSAADYPALEQAVMRMAYTYSLYSPSKIPDATGATDPQPDFLNRLWWAQNDYQANQLDDGIASLTTYLQGVEQPAKAMQFVSNLLLAAKQVVSIREDLQDPLFFQELLKFGFEYAKLNPDISLSDQPQGFLDTLWRTHAGTQGFAQAIRTGASGLSNLFGQLDSKEKRQDVLEFGERLMQAAKLAPSLQQQVKDPQFVDALLGLGGAYASLEPTALPAAEADPQLFLNTLWQGQDLPKGARELEDFLNIFETSDEQLKMLRFEKNLLKTVKLVPDLQEEMQNPLNISEIFNKGILYATLESTVDYFEDLNYTYSNEWFSYVWESNNDQSFKVAAASLQAFIDETQIYYASEPGSGALPAPSATEIVVAQYTPVPDAPPVVSPVAPVPPVPPVPYKIPLWILPWIVTPGLPLNPWRTAPPVGAEINPITGKGYWSQEEYDLVQSLTPGQRAELSRLPRNKAFVSYLRKDRDSCVSGEIPHQGGRLDPFNILIQGSSASDSRRANKYAEYVTGSTSDYYILAPDGLGITYDGRTPGTRTVWEVKAPRVKVRSDENGTWLHNAISNPSSWVGKKALNALAALTAQRQLQKEVAEKCLFTYKYATASKGMADFLNAYWSADPLLISPRVEFKPYPYLPFP
jgi:hypothetical protein